VHDFNPGCPIYAFSREFSILGVDNYTQHFMLANYGKNFSLGDNEEPRV
jgi:hypothetical protein